MSASSSSSSSAGGRPEPVPVPDSVQVRVANLVHIMKGRWSPFSRLGVLELDGESLSLRDAEGGTLFSVPADRAEAQNQYRIAVHQVFFKVRADERWWYLVPHAPSKYERSSTRQLVERYRVDEEAPRPKPMTAERYRRDTKNPIGHQLLWKVFWLVVLRPRDDQAPDAKR